MLNELPREMMQAIREAISAEQKISYGNPDEYNNLVSNAKHATAVSASGRVSMGPEEVKLASVGVSRGNVGERFRTIDFISGDYSCDSSMFYGLFSSGVTVIKENGTESNLNWIITLVMKKENDRWRIIHRQNTRRGM